MKKITLLMAAFFVAVGMNAQIFEEDFELGLGDWTVVSNTGQAVWHVANEAFPNLSASPWGPGPLVFDSNIALIDDDADGPGTDSSTLISPIINLAGGSNLTLSFDYFNVIFELQPTLAVEVFDGSSWVEVLFVVGDAANTATTDPNEMFLSEVIDITPYANASFQVRFIYDDDGGWQFGAAVDNFVIDGNLSVSDTNIDGFNYFYSPQSQNLTISATENFSSITIFNVLGQQVVNKNLSSTNEVINLSSLKSGVYIANVVANGQTTTFKLAKR
jgi:hypothetical protein